MTSIDTAKALINSRVVAGSPGSITAAKLNATLIALADAIVADRVPANIPTSVSSPLSGANLEDVLTALAVTIAAKANVESPALTGTPTAPTADSAVSSTQIATTAFVQNVIAALVDSSPGALDTLNELAAALGDDADFATTVTNALALKAPLASPALTGSPTAPTASSGTNTTQIATTEFVQSVAAALSAAGSSNALAAQNIIVNGEMRISQENGTTSMTATDSYPADQWQVHRSTVVSGFQKNAGGPPGYSHFLRSTITTASATGFCYFRQRIEGFRLDRLAWGTASAKPARLSFWVRSSVTGTFEVLIQDAGLADRFTATFTIAVADTWEFKTVAVTAITAGTWTGGAVLGGAINIGSSVTNIGHQNTTSATLDITGVTIIPGEDAITDDLSPYVQRHYDDELRLCKRYWQSGAIYVGSRSGDNYYIAFINWPVELRANPSITLSSAATGTLTNTTTSWLASKIGIAAGAWTSSVTANARM